MTPEGRLQNAIRLALSEAGVLNFRNNTGLGWAGRPVKGQGKLMYVGPDDVVVRNARPLRAGLTKEGSHDIIGIKSVIVTPAMVGQKFGLFVSLECKTKTGRPTKDQLLFMDAVREAGGIAEVVRSEEEAISAVRQGTQ